MLMCAQASAPADLDSEGAYLHGTEGDRQVWSSDRLRADLGPRLWKQGDTETHSGLYRNTVD